MNASAYMLASHIGASIKGRNFAPGSSPLAAGCSPGPQAYTPQEEAASVKPRAARTAFGSARRAQQEKLYLGCEQLNKAAGTSAIGPGPAAYRSQEGNVFISKQHAAADPGRLVAAAIPGPRYDVAGKLQLLSTHKSDGSAGFGSKSTAKLYLSPEHVKSDPTLSCSPGPSTAGSSLPGCMASPLGRAATAPRFGSPPRSPRTRGPFISKQHEADLAGLDSPGPACYDAAGAAAALAGSVLGDRRTAHFGSGEREVAAKVKRSFAPGPGAYAGELTKLSTHASSPAFSLGASLPGSSMLGPATAAHQAPGVGAYSIALADGQCLPHSGAITIKGKLQQGGIAAKNCSPGPAAYARRDGDSSPASCGIHRDSPGPAAYQVDERLTVRYGGSCKLNSRAAPERLYISKLHAESQAGIDSPGPAAYGDTSDAQHSSTSRNPSPSKRPPTSGFSFGCGGRPEIAKIRF
ncbi:hypothetical protein OEZ85_012464 [Tetradesmus obliquus]|uniref:Flagellar associated protein n=1 Tax=Tetradesmus obliquus TaxID=3088 RepID=A0ABY8TTW0_TETOB|nr:hypothetical protein OEZ85_012464 [Tetradesmus obliquus]